MDEVGDMEDVGDASPGCSGVFCSLLLLMTTRHHVGRPRLAGESRAAARERQGLTARGAWQPRRRPAAGLSLGPQGCVAGICSISGIEVLADVGARRWSLCLLSWLLRWSLPRRRVKSMARSCCTWDAIESP
jgi:hypothetical protein